jgi:hypothetical protein
VTASELAFLGLGLLLGAATGAALIVVLGTRSPRREIRVTVTRDALPRRSETLSQDAFVTSPSEPARGGPADRRWFDRDDPVPDRRGTLGVPVMELRGASSKPVGGFYGPSMAAPDRTSVPFVASAVAVTEAPEAASPPDETLRQPPARSPLERMLRGEHGAMVEVVDAVAGQDGARRRDWELLLTGLVEAMADMATRESVIDFPMGTAFWDTFTVEQCRRIVTALASMGFRYDGRSGWVEHHVPVYRDVSLALADIGVDPRRVRAWPNQAELAALFDGARPAPDELLAAAGPDYRVEDMQALLGEHASELAGLWIAWGEARPALLGAGFGAGAATNQGFG